MLSDHLLRLSAHGTHACPAARLRLTSCLTLTTTDEIVIGTATSTGPRHADTGTTTGNGIAPRRDVIVMPVTMAGASGGEARVAVGTGSESEMEKIAVETRTARGISGIGEISPRPG